jgi:hypothetical protein
MRKENIINDLSDKLKSTMQQQERDKGQYCFDMIFYFYFLKIKNVKKQLH